MFKNKNNHLRKKSSTEYWIYGKHSSIAAIKNKNRIIKKIIISENKYEKYILLLKNNLNFKIHEKIILKVKDNYFDNIIKKNIKHQGIAVKVKELKQYDIKKFFNNIDEKKEKTTCVLLYKITDPHNTGAIIRSAPAFNIKNILITKHNSSKENETVARVSSGAIDGVDIYILNNLDSTLKIYSKKGWFIIGLDGSAQEDIKNLKKWNLDEKKILIIMGSEHKGINKIIKKHCDIIFKITINTEKVESLNVSCASSIAFYEVSKNV